MYDHASKADFMVKDVNSKVTGVLHLFIYLFIFKCMPGQCTFLLLVACPSPTRALNAFYKPLSGDHTGQDGVLQLICFSHIIHLECLRNCIAASLCTNFSSIFFRKCFSDSLYNEQYRIN